jgi:hypothetical protein
MCRIQTNYTPQQFRTIYSALLRKLSCVMRVAYYWPHVFMTFHGNPIYHFSVLSLLLFLPFWLSELIYYSEICFYNENRPMGMGMGENFFNQQEQ